MSETDDTDVLLLIPPDFFLVRSSGSEDSILESSRTVVHKPLSCTAQVIGKLVDQVHSIESRLGSLEINSSITDSSLGTIPRRNNWDTSFDCHSADQRNHTFPRRRRRKVLRRVSRDLSLTSLDSASIKTVPPLPLKDIRLTNLDPKSEILNDTNSMDGDISSIKSTPSKKNDKLLLHEIDEFLNKVEAYETPDSRCKDSDVTLSPENVIKATGDYISQKLDRSGMDEVRLPSGRIIPSTILDKYIYLVNSNPQSATDKLCPSTSTHKVQYGDHKGQYADHRAQYEDHKEQYADQKTRGQFLDQKGQYVDQKGQYTDTRGQFLDQKGQYVDEKRQYADHKAQYADHKVQYKDHKAQYEDHKAQYEDPRPLETPKTSEATKPAQETKSPIRRLNFSDTKDVQPTSTPKKPPSTSSHVDTFRPSSNKIYDRATKVLEQYKSHSKSQNADSFACKDDMFRMPQMRPFTGSKECLKSKYLDTIDTELLSLSELWGEKDKGDRGDSLKLEEERLKREHCEGLIQQLQKKILDQQEKLAVAIRVDRAKDAAITKLRDAWLRLTGGLERAEDRHRAALDRMLAEVDKFKAAACEAQKKTEHFEAELYKALDLAHDYQEKCKQLTIEAKQSQENAAIAIQGKDDLIARRDHEIAAMKENYETVMRLNKQSTDCVKNLEDALEKERMEHEVTKKRASDLSRELQTAADDAALARQQADLLREKVNEERSRATLLERQLAERQAAMGELVDKCDNQDVEIKTLRKHLELQKSELKTHYQKQLEDAVVAKLQEFQRQLDAAEREMENDARAKEAAIVDGYSKQIGRIEEQHKLEVNVLEEKQREEIKLYRLQLAQASEKIGLLETKLESYRRRRGQIASQLHGVMEAQWRQALLILTNGNAASSLDHTRADSTSTPVGQDYAPPKLPLAPFDRPPHPSHPAQTHPPLHHHNASLERNFNFEALSDHELQQYVRLLLTKPPNVDGSGDAAAIVRDVIQRDVIQRDSVDASEEPTSDRASIDKRLKRSLPKPPWKA